MRTPNSSPPPTLSEWLQAVPGLRKRSAGRWAGPCPVCGGEDRFHVEAPRGNRVLWGCRGCLDGTSDRRTATRRILATAFPHRLTQPVSKARPQPPEDTFRPTHSKHTNQTTKRKTATAQRLWAATLPCSDTPAAEYLHTRRVWPDIIEQPCGLIPLPDSIAWLPRRIMPRGPDLPVLPVGAGGAITFRYQGANGKTQAVGLEALNPQGRPLKPRRWRRTVGAKTNAAFYAGCPGGSPVVVAEGEINALAASWLHGAEAECIAVGGTAGMTTWQPAPDDFRPVIIECDGDLPGVTAAIQVERRLQRMGRLVKVRWRGPSGDDPANELSKQVLSVGWHRILGIG